jgi:beta-lactamase superfamily II metal-dependent hydrolase
LGKEECVRDRLKSLLWIFLLFSVASFSWAANLEIHYINVGWGGSILLVGPNGTTVLMEAGNPGKGTARVVPYLQSLGIIPAAGIDYVIGGHQHCDHIGGIAEVVNAGYDVHLANYYNGSTYSTSCSTSWRNAALTTTAGAIQTMPLGTIVDLGSGATITCVAVNGQIYGGGYVPVSDENDRSIALLIQYGSFDFLWASDLGGGPDTEPGCSERSTTQVDIESDVIAAITAGNTPLVPVGAIDVLHVNHHGSESSTNKNWMNVASPSVAVVSVGAGQASNYNLPRKRVVENVLLAGVSCITAGPALVLQTEEGNPSDPTKTSFAGFCVGDLVITTDGISTFDVSADGNVTFGPDERTEAGLPRTIPLH